MSKKSQKKSKNKKRNKKYSGVDAKAGPVKITRIKAKQRSPLGEWFVERRKKFAAWGILVGTLLVLYGVFSWLFGLIF